MHTVNDQHEQFAAYFGEGGFRKYAYQLSKGLSEGHICIQVASAERAAVAAMPLVGDGGRLANPFILDGSSLYIQRYYRYETQIVERLQAFLAAEKVVLAEREELVKTHSEFISGLFHATVTAGETEPVNWQLAAAVSCLLNDFTIITGGPGTGKTTTVSKVLQILYKAYPALNVALAAPTGKAAARMGESLGTAFPGLEPSTIHRLLKPITGTPYFRHDAANPLPHDVVIVDESSMVDVAMFAKLLQAVKRGARLIMLGDKEQLASVEAGSLFGDLCGAYAGINRFSAMRRVLVNGLIQDPAQQIPVALEAEAGHPLFEHIVELRRSHRFSAQRGIGRFCRAVIENDTAVLESFFLPRADPEISIDESHNEKIFENFVEGYVSFIQEPDTLAALRQLARFRVLCAVREGPQGVYAVNRASEQVLAARHWVRPYTEFYLNRPIILSKNYPEHGLYNGDTGILRLDADGTMMACFDDGAGGVKMVLPGYLPDCETAFAMTIHKSQGSEFEEVLIALPDSPDIPILTRELLYTAASRAKKKAWLQGSAAAIFAAASRFVQRASGIAGRLK